MKILITAAEVLQAVADYAKAQGVSIDDSNPIILTPEGTVEMSINSLGGSAPTPAPEAKTTTEVTIDEVNTSIWDRKNWIQLRKTGFTAFVTANIETFGACDPSTQAAISEKWAKITEDPFPKTAAAIAKLADAEGGTTVGDVITTAAGGDTTDKDEPTLDPELPAEVTPGEEDSPAETTTSDDDTESLFGMD
jgi:hypothetical protein